MIGPEILRKVRALEVQTRGLVTSVFSGEYHSIFKGQGMEFAEVREYQPGDDPRQIDWNVTARLDAPFVKLFTEEREQILVLVVDASASGLFGSADRLKCEVGAEVAAVLAFSAIANKDRVGLVIFTDRIEKVIPPKKGRTHVLRVLREILYFEPRGRGTDLATPLSYLSRVLRRRSTVLVVSDFLASGYEQPLKVLARRHDVIGLLVKDPREESLPPVGLVEVRDPETGERLTADTSDPSLRKAFQGRASVRLAALRGRLSTLGVDLVELSTATDWFLPLIAFFRRRLRRARR